MKYITCTDTAEVFGSDFDGDPVAENDTIAAAAENAGITVIRHDDSYATRRAAEQMEDAGGEEIDWFAQWCADENTDWNTWFSNRA